MACMWRLTGTGGFNDGGQTGLEAPYLQQFNADRHYTLRALYTTAKTAAVVYSDGRGGHPTRGETAFPPTG